MPEITKLAAGTNGTAPFWEHESTHVLLVVDGFPKVLGGGERIVLRLASLLPRYGFRVSILTFVVHPESSFRPADAPCPVYLLPLTNTYGPGALRGALAMRRFLHKERVEIVQTFFESSDIWAGAVTRLFSSAKLIWSRRDMGILRGAKHRLAYRALKRFPHAVFAVSAKVAEHVTQVDGVSPHRVHVIYNGLDLKPGTGSHAHPSGPPVVTTIGNIRRVKGHDVLVHAAREVANTIPEVKFTIAGEVLEIDYFEELQQLIADLGLSANVQFVGKVSDLQHHLASATVFVLPSRSEGFSNALIEAMSVDLPCVATDVGGNAEAVQDRVSGLIVPPEDATALAKAIVTILLDTALARTYAAGAIGAVEAKFTAHAMMQKITQVYQSLLMR